jgi:hypothetical protein
MEYGLLGPYSWEVYKIWAFRAIFQGKLAKYGLLGPYLEV